MNLFPRKHGLIPWSLSVGELLGIKWYKPFFVATRHGYQAQRFIDFYNHNLRVTIVNPQKGANVPSIKSSAMPSVRINPLYGKNTRDHFLPPIITVTFFDACITR